MSLTYLTVATVTAIVVVVVIAAHIVFDKGNEAHRKYSRADTGKLGGLLIYFYYL